MCACITTVGDARCPRQCVATRAFLRVCVNYVCARGVCELLPFPIPLCVCVQYRPFFLFDVPPLVVCVCRCPLFLLDDTLASHTLAFYLCVRFKVCPCVCDSRPPPFPCSLRLPPLLCAPTDRIVVINNNVFVFVSSSFTPKKKKKTCWLYVGAVYFEEQGVLFYVYTRRNIIYFHRCVYLFFIIYF